MSRSVIYYATTLPIFIHLAYLLSYHVLFDFYSSEPRSVNLLYLFLGGKRNSTPVKEKRLRSSEGSKPSIQKAKRLQPKALIPTPFPRSNAPPQIQTAKTQQKKNRYTFLYNWKPFRLLRDKWKLKHEIDCERPSSLLSVFNEYISLFSTPPFSSDEDETVEDSAYVTSSRAKPSTSVRLVQSGSLMNPTAEPDWTDSELSETADTPKLLKTPNPPNPHGEQIPNSYTYFIYFNHNKTIWN